jgi:hypothetical protein
MHPGQGFRPYRDAFFISGLSVIRIFAAGATALAASGHFIFVRVRVWLAVPDPVAVLKPFYVV